jgi:hypothetical protein
MQSMTEKSLKATYKALVWVGFGWGLGGVWVGVNKFNY